MRKWVLLCIAIVVLLIVISCVPTFKYNGGYEARPASASMFDDGPKIYGSFSFWELSPWIQMFYLSCVAASLLIVIKLLPFVIFKLKRKSANRNRESIYRHISGNPGCTVSDISKQESMNEGSVRYHVDRLRDARRIVMVKFGKFNRLFHNTGAYDDREITVISALQVRACRDIIFLIRDNPGLYNKQIAERLDIRESMAHMYLTDLLAHGIIRYEKKGQQKMYFLESDVEAILAKVADSTAGRNCSAAV